MRDAVIVHALALVLLAISFLQRVDAQGQHDPQFKKAIPCAQLSNGNYVWGCSRFYSMCANGREHSMNCYDNLVLNPDNNQCDEPKNVWACQNPQSDAIYRAKDPFTCIGKRDGSYASEQCSGHYIVCIGEQQQVQTCPAGTVFNGQQGICDHIANCKKSAVQDHVAPIKLNNNKATVSAQRSAMIQPMNATPKRVNNFQLRRNLAGPSYSIAQPQGSQAPNPSLSDTFIVNGQQTAPNAPEGYGPTASLDTTVVNDASAPDCSGKPDGIYVYGTESCSNSFWKCANGYAFEYECPADLFYDESINQCTHREFITSCGGTPPQTTVAPVVYAPPSSPLYGEQLTVTTQFDCTGKKDGFYEEMPCSPEYFSCNAGISWALKCASGTVFDKESAVCEYPQLCGKAKPTSPPQDEHGAANFYFNDQNTKPATAATPYQTAAAPSYQNSAASSSQNAAPSTQSATSYKTAAPYQQTPTKLVFNCTGKPDGYYYKKKCTASFIICSKGHLSQQQCPTGLLFDPFLANCQYALQCGKSTTTVPPVTTTTAIPYIATTPKLDFNCNGKPDGYYAKQPCTSTFFSCASGQTIQFNCPPTLVFDTNAKICEYPNICGTTATTMVAPAYGDTNQDDQGQKDVTYGGGGGNPYGAPQSSPQKPTKRVKPQYNCGGKADGFYAEKPCQPTYFTCVANEAIENKCQSGLVFNAESEFCDYPQSCAAPKTTAVVASPPAGYYTTNTPAAAPTPPSTYATPPPRQPASSSSYSSSPPASPAPKPTSSYSKPPSPTVGEKQKFTCAGKRDGYWTRGNCKASFLVCTHGHMLHMNCPTGLFLDMDTKMCEHKQTCGQPNSPPVLVNLPVASSFATPVAEPSAQKPNYDCTAKTGQFALGKCQSSYIVCVHDTPHLYNCPGQSQYDADTQRCEHAHECGKIGKEDEQDNYDKPLVYVPSPTIAPPPQESPQNSAPAPSDDNTCGQIPMGTHSLYKCSSDYLRCYNGKIALEKCQGQLIYSQQTGYCEPVSRVAGCAELMTVNNNGGVAKNYNNKPKSNNNNNNNSGGSYESKPQQQPPQQQQQSPPSPSPPPPPVATKNQYGAAGAEVPPMDKHKLKRSFYASKNEKE